MSTLVIPNEPAKSRLTLAARRCWSSLIRLYREKAISAAFAVIALVWMEPNLAETTPPDSARSFRTTLLFESTGMQDYRIEVFSSGAVTYSGRARVATIGERRISVSPEQVEALAQKLLQSTLFDNIPALVQAPDVGPRLLTNTVAVYSGSRAKYITYQEVMNGRLHASLYRLFEEYVPTESLRCPFIEPQTTVSRGGDVCKIRERGMQAVTK